LHHEGRLGLIAIDEAHLLYDWQDFRQTYRQCEECTLFPGIPLMALSTIVTPDIQIALETFLNNPVVERSTVNRDNIYLAVEK
jgi:superfamily II DNA helicase RecQ